MTDRISREAYTKLYKTKNEIPNTLDQNFFIN